MLDGDVVFEGVSPGFEYVIAVQQGLRHELEFDPFATLLESWKTLPLLHPPAPIRPENTKGATGGPRLFCSIYPEYQIDRGKVDKIWTLYLAWFHGVEADRAVLAY